jgi:ABC-type cobalamin transport system permease subunit
MTTINEKLAINFEESKEWYMGGFGGMKWKRKLCNYIVISRIIIIKKTTLLHCPSHSLL